MPVLQRYRKLRGIGVIRQVLRRWWGLELAYARADGYVADHAGGVIIPPDNALCAASLHSREGFRRCNQSVQAAGERFGAGGSGLLHECHLGLRFAAWPVHFRGTVQGFVFAGGFLVAAPSKRVRSVIAEKMEEMGARIERPGRVVDQVKVLGAAERERLLDLLRVAAEEIRAAEEAGVNATGLLAAAPSLPQAGTGTLRELLEAVERAHIAEGLIRTHWNKSRLARELGISRSTLIAKIERYGLEAER